MYEIAELMEGARNCVVGYTGVRKGENVIVWTDRSGKVDPLVVEAMILAIEEVGAKAIIINEKAPIFRLGDSFSKPVFHAVANADAVIQVFELDNAAAIDNFDCQRIMFEYETRITLVITNTAELLASPWARFPAGLSRALRRKATAQVKDGPFRIADPLGTDLKGYLKGCSAEVFTSKGPPMGFSLTFFPGTTLAFHPESPVNGVVVFEAMEGFRGLLKEPVRLTVKDHWVTEVEGGHEARWLERMMKKYRNGNYFCEISWGVNPKPSITKGLQETAADTILFRHAGVFHCGVGLWPGLGIPCEFHWDGGGLHPTITIGNEVIVANGHLKLLDDPEVREIAREYGDPDELLAEEP